MVRFALACAIALAPLALLAVPKRVARGTALQLGHDGAGPRHFLAGRAVHAGTPLLLMMADGSSLAGRYQNRQFDDGTLLGRFHFEVRNDPAAGIAYSEAAIDLPPDAELRWP